MNKCLLAMSVCLLVFGHCDFADAQGRLKGKLGRGGAALGNKESSSASNDKRNDVEGTIWEFKVIDRKEKDKTKELQMTGRFRIKESSVFSVGAIEMVGQAGGQGKANQGGGARGAGELKELLAQRMKKAKERDTGGERIGDLSKATLKEYIIRFDEDDQYPLSGRVELKPDSKNKGGVWSGKYVEYLEGNKKKSWRMEMRKVED